MNMKLSTVPMLWHAFQALKERQTDLGISRSKAKSITLQLTVKEAQMQLMTDFEGVFHEDTTTAVTYSNYIDFLWQFYFSKHENINVASSTSSTPEKGKEKEKNVPSSCFHFHYDSRDAMWRQIDFFCWELYKNKFCRDLPENLTTESIHSLWLLFNTFCNPRAPGEKVDENIVSSDHTPLVLPPKMDQMEAYYWLERVGKLLGVHKECIESDEQYSYQGFQELFSKYMENENKFDLEAALETTVDEVVHGTMMRGFLQLNQKDKKSSNKPQWKPRWCILGYNSFIALNEDDTPDIRTQIDISDALKIQSYTEKNNRNNRFQVTCFDESWLFEASDIICKLKWINSFKNAMEYKLAGIQNPEVRLCHNRATERNKNRQETLDKANEERLKQETEEQERKAKEDDFNSRIVKLENDLSNKTNEIWELNAKQDETTASYTKEKLSLETRIEQLLGENETAKQEHNAKEDDFNSRIAKLENVLSNKSNEICELHAKQDETTASHVKEKQSLENRIEQLLGENETSKQEFEASKNALQKETEDERTQWQTKLQAESEAKDLLEADLQNEKLAHTRLEEELRTEKDNIEQEKKSREILAQEFESFKSETSSAHRAEIESCKQMETELRNEIETMKVESESVRTSAAAKHEETEQLLTSEIQKRASKEQELSDSQEKTKQLQEENTQFKEDIKTLMSRNEEAKETIANLEDKIKKLSSVNVKIGSHRGEGFLPKTS